MKQILKALTSMALIAAAVVGAISLVPVGVYADDKTPVQNAQGGLKSVDPEGGAGTDLTTRIQQILQTIFLVIGIIAVIMIILGGINYTMSQGDPGKVKKAKDTILYGIIGLVVTLSAFAIVTFVMNALK